MAAMAQRAFEVLLGLLLNLLMDWETRHTVAHALVTLAWITAIHSTWLPFKIPWKLQLVQDAVAQTAADAPQYTHVTLSL